MFANFTYFKDDEKYVHNFRLKDDDGKLATDRYNIHFIELTKLRKIVREKLNSKNLSELEFWSILLKFNCDEKIMSKLNSIPQFQEEIKMATSALREITQEEKDWAYHLSFDRAEADYNNGLRSAKEEGAHDKAIETAKNLLKMGLGTLEQISDSTGLPLEEVKNLQTN